MQEAMHQQALLQINPGASSQILFDPSWHLGIVGLIASRVREVAKVPTLAFAWDEGKQCFKGSGRSIAGVHLKHLLDAVSNQDSSLMINFGGHAQAVGLSVYPEAFERFKVIFQDIALQALQDAPREVDIVYDGVLPETHLEQAWFMRLYQSHPFGQGFEEPVYALNVRGIKTTITKGGHEHITCYASQSKRQISAWIFKGSLKNNAPLPQSGWMFFQYLGSDAAVFRVKCLGVIDACADLDVLTHTSLSSMEN
jgi:single-stranded DNA-specific DHH superfamily exonuclease